MNYREYLRFLLKISQIIRSPGVYFEKQKKDNSITGTIIPNKGSWITLKMDV